jgi:YD repeat-containing protein
MTETIQGVTTTYGYTYDTAGRLTEVTHNGATVSTYSYDSNGNRLTKAVPGQPSPVTYAYDALGNLRAATLGNGKQLGYVIDGENRRVGKTVNGSLVQGFLYENQLEPVAELDGSGNLVSRFVYCGCGAGRRPESEKRRIGEPVNRGTGESGNR